MDSLHRQLRDEKVLQFILDAANLVPASASPDEETT
jgi:hypothetical protein